MLEFAKEKKPDIMYLKLYVYYINLVSQRRSGYFHFYDKLRIVNDPKQREGCDNSYDKHFFKRLRYWLNNTVKY